VKAVVEGGRITHKMCTRAHHSASFAYVLTSRQALSLLEQLHPFLRTYKAGRARLLLDEYSGVATRNGRYSAKQLAARERFEARFFAISTRATARVGSAAAAATLALHQERKLRASQLSEPGHREAK
jgi:hypothetical protein